MSRNRGCSLNKPDGIYIRLACGFVYLVAVIDWYSQYEVQRAARFMPNRLLIYSSNLYLTVPVVR